MFGACYHSILVILDELDEFLQALIDEYYLDLEGIMCGIFKVCIASI